MKSYKLSVDGKELEVVHIAEIAQETGRSVQSLRYLIETGNQVRKLKRIYDRSRIMIPKTEIEGYPFITQGSGNAKSIYHYRLENGKYVKYTCTECTFGTEGCAARKIADDLEVPGEI